MANNREDHGLVMTEADILTGSLSQGESKVKEHSGTSTPLVVSLSLLCIQEQLLTHFMHMCCHHDLQHTFTAERF